MQNENDKVDFDISLVGSASYGFSLEVYLKRKDRVRSHHGCELQLLFRKKCII